MKALLVMTLTACGIYAVPLPGSDSEVDLVPRRRVYTAGGGQQMGPANPAAPAGGHLWPANTRHILRQLFGAGFPRLVPRVNSNCDSGNFPLSDHVYAMVEKCERSQATEHDMKQCIVAGLPENATELSNFLDRDEFSIAGISSSLTVVMVNTKVTMKRAVTFTLCPPSDERNTVEDEEDEIEDTPQSRPPPGQTFHPDRPTFRDGTGLFDTARPKFQLPGLFSQHNPFFNFEDAFKPFFNNRPGGMFPSFPNFDFDVTDFPSYDPERCVKQTFQLPKEQFDKARNCHYGTDPFKECLREELGDSEEAKDLLQFVADDEHIVVDRRFFSSVSSINGEVTRKNKIQLTRCQSADNDQTTEEEQQEETEQTADSSPELTPKPAAEQEGYVGENFEP